LAGESIRVKVGDHWYTVEIKDLSTSPVEVSVNGETVYVEIDSLPPTSQPPARPSQLRQPRQTQSPAPSPAPGALENVILSPMPGRVVAIKVSPGDSVSAGQEVCVVEAMKMEQSIRVHRQATIKAVRVKPMDQVGADQPLIELE
jgi:biotin carboxyl carrier protein